MEWWIYVLLLVAGTLMIMLEVFTPHGIAAICGVAVIGVSAVLCIQNEGWQAGLLYSLVALGIAGFSSLQAFRAGVRLMALKPPRNKKGAQNLPRAEPKPAVGERAIVVQPLRPTGTIEWRGHRLAARAADAAVEFTRGETVVIRDRDSIYWLVERAYPDSSIPS